MKERKKKYIFSYVQKQEAQSTRKDNSFIWKSQIHKFGRRHYNSRYTKDSRKAIKDEKILGYNMKNDIRILKSHACLSTEEWSWTFYLKRNPRLRQEGA